MTCRLKVWPIICGVALFGAIQPPACPADTKSDREVLFPSFAVKILGYIEWPSEAVYPEAAKVRIGVYDKTPGREYYRKFRKLRRELDSFELTSLSGSGVGLDDVNVVYIAGESTEIPKELQDAFEGKAILVICENDGFHDDWGIIRFQQSDDKRLEYGINLKRANALGLSIRARLQDKAVELVR